MPTLKDIDFEPETVPLSLSAKDRHSLERMKMHTVTQAADGPFPFRAADINVANAQLELTDNAVAPLIARCVRAKNDILNRHQLAGAFNAILDKPDLYTLVDINKLQLDPDTSGLLHDIQGSSSVAADELPSVRKVNKAILCETFPGTLHTAKQAQHNIVVGDNTDGRHATITRDIALENKIASAKHPESRVKIPRNAWAWDMRSRSSQMNEETRRILKRYELYLCCHIVSLVEHKSEKIFAADIDLVVSGEESVIFRMWPTETFRSCATLSAQAKLSATIGLTQSLQIVELPLKGEAGVVWQGKWEWASALVKASGIGDDTAKWELLRDPSAPFSGDRELYLLVQLPRGRQLSSTSATVKARIRPRWWRRSFIYESPIDITYHVS